MDDDQLIAAAAFYPPDALAQYEAWRGVNQDVLAPLPPERMRVDNVTTPAGSEIVHVFLPLDVAAQVAFPTDPVRERGLGRVPLWLDVKEVRWLADGCCCGRDVTGTTPHTWECKVIRFRANAALHKEGLKGETGR